MCAVLWDLLQRALPTEHVRRVQGFRCLGRRVPLTLLLAVILDGHWCLYHAFRWGRRSWDMIVTAQPWNVILYNSAQWAIVIKFVICLLAAAYNLRVYLLHSRALAALPWSFFCKEPDGSASAQGDDRARTQGVSSASHAAETRLRDVGLNPKRLRKANCMYGPLYLGMVLASLFVGSLIAAIFPVLFVVLLVVCWLLPGTRPTVWTYAFAPVVKTALSYGVLLCIVGTMQGCLWGDMRRFPRRPAMLAQMDFLVFCSMTVGWPLLGAYRLLKSALVSVLGLLVVTSPGTHESWLLSDSAHFYYLSILRVERFRQEVEEGAHRNAHLGCRSHAWDCFSYNCRLWGIVVSAMLVYFVMQLFFGIETAPALEDAGSLFSIAPALEDAGSLFSNDQV